MQDWPPFAKKEGVEPGDLYGVAVLEDLFVQLPPGSQRRRTLRFRAHSHSLWNTALPVIVIAVLFASAVMLTILPALFLIIAAGQTVR